MQDFKTAFKRGIPMTKKSILFWLGILALFVAVAGVIYTPFYIASLKDAWYKYFAWFLFLCLILIFIIPFALTPYFGMREIKREKEEDYKRDTTKLSIIKEQKNNVNRYVYCRFSHLYLRGKQQIDVEIELFNGTLFELSLESVHDGVIRIDCFHLQSMARKGFNPMSVIGYDVG